MVSLGIIESPRDAVKKLIYVYGIRCTSSAATSKNPKVVSGSLLTKQYQRHNFRDSPYTIIPLQFQVFRKHVRQSFNIQPSATQL